jgi:hypothetical protein
MAISLSIRVPGLADRLARYLDGHAFPAFSVSSSRFALGL